MFQGLAQAALSQAGPHLKKSIGAARFGPQLNQVVQLANTMRSSGSSGYSGAINALLQAAMG